ncbi:hypothetical protein ACI78T_06820 [Blastococcus sp. SYSU D00922]
MRSLGVLRIGLLAAVGVLGAVLVVLSTRRYGLSLSPDSMYYLAGARGIAGGDGVVGLDGEPMSLYPPGLPLVLALPAALGVAQGAALGLNATLLGATAFGVGLFLARRIRFPLAAGAAVVVATSTQLLGLHTWLWSEPLYTALSLAYLAVLVRAAGTAERSWRTPVLAGLVAAAATLTRYTGVSLIPVGALVLVLRPGTWRRRIRDLLVFGVAWAGPVGAWLARNAATTGHLAGERASNQLTPVQVAIDAVRGIQAWVVPESVRVDAQDLALLVYAVAAVGVLVAALRRLPARDDPRVHVLAIAGGYAVLAALVIYCMTVTSNVDRLDARLLVPLFPAALVAFAAALDIAMDNLPRLVGAAVAGAAGLAFALNVAYSLPALLEARGGGFNAMNSPERATPEARRLVEAVPADATLVTNQPWLAAHLTDGRPAVESPRAHYYASTEVPDDLADLAATLDGEPVYLVWFDAWDDYHVPPADLAAAFDLQPLQTTGAGTVFTGAG